MKALFATYRDIRGVESNEAKSNGANVAVIAMGTPLVDLIDSSKLEEQTEEIIELLYVNQLIDAQLPDLDQLVIYLGHHGITQTIALGEYFLEKNNDGKVLFVSCDCDMKKKLSEYEKRPFLCGGSADIFTFSHDEGLEKDRVMQIMLQRFLALGTLDWHLWRH